MPAPTNIVMLFGDPKNYQEPMTIELAKARGFTDIWFYPTLAEAGEAAIKRRLADDIKTETFDEAVKIGGRTYVLHVLATTRRPKPVMKSPIIAYANYCGQLNRPKISSDGMKPWPEYEHVPAYSPRLNAFAWFMGEWAAKIKKGLSR